MERTKFYFFSYGDGERKRKMEQRFEQLGIVAECVKSVERDDPRIVEVERKLSGALQDENFSLGDEEKRLHSVTLNHLDMLRTFVEESDKEFGFFCEDDVYISKNLKPELSYLLHKMTQLNLDILLVGYLIHYYPRRLVPENHHFPLLTVDLTFHSFPDDIWGSQAYILTRKHAQYLLEKLSVDYAVKAYLCAHKQVDEDKLDADGVKIEIDGVKLKYASYNPDWCLTKMGNRALVYPMYCVEEGNVKTTNSGQIQFHRDCTDFNYKPDQFV